MLNHCATAPHFLSQRQQLTEVGVLEDTTALVREEESGAVSEDTVTLESRRPPLLPAQLLQTTQSHASFSPHR